MMIYFVNLYIVGIIGLIVLFYLFLEIIFIYYNE